MPQKHGKAASVSNPRLCEAGISAVTAATTRLRSRLDTSGVAASRHPRTGPPGCRKPSSGLPVFPYRGGSCDYFIVCTLQCNNSRNNVMHDNVMCLNHPKSTPLGPWKNCVPRNLSLVPKRLGTATLLCHCNVPLSGAVD